MMKDIKDFIIESRNVDAEKEWKKYSTKKLEKIVDKEWPAMREFFEVLVPAAVKLNKSPKLVMFYLLDTIDNGLIPEFESMTLQDAVGDFEAWLTTIDADMEGTDIDSYIRGW